LDGRHSEYFRIGEHGKTEVSHVGLRRTFGYNVFGGGQGGIYAFFAGEGGQGIRDYALPGILRLDHGFETP
jgi:hypothetical protein